MRQLELQSIYDHYSSSIAQRAAVVSRELLEPLCPRTDALLQPLKFWDNDRMDVSLSEDGETFVTQAYGLRRDGTRTSGSHDAMRRWQPRMPERKEQGYGRWFLKTTDFNALVISSVWSPERLTFTDEAKITYDFLLSRFLSQTVKARARALFERDGTLPPDPPDWFDHPRLPLKPYQKLAAILSLDTEGDALFMQQGTGKTPITIRRICIEARRKKLAGRGLYRVIVVCPKNVRSNWGRELERFTTTPGKVVALRGGQLHRVKQIVEAMTPDADTEWSMVICSYEAVQNSWDALRLIEFDLAVADESHYIKSPVANRTKHMMKLRDRSLQRMVLTGTPYGNQISDLWAQLEFLGRGQSGFTSYKNFSTYYNRFTKERDEQGRRYLIGFKNLPVLKERLARMSFIISLNKAQPDLPELRFDILEVEMSRKQADYYKRMQANLAVEIEADLARAAENRTLQMTATNVLTKLLRLSQITSGYVTEDVEYTDEGETVNENRIHFFDSVPKMDAVIEEIKNKGPKSKTIVWSCWVPVIKELSRRLTIEGIRHDTYYGATSDKERDRIEREFNEDPDLKVFIGNPRAGGVGLNLQGYVPDWAGTPKDHGCNTDHVIFYACNWSMLDRSQATMRAQRAITRVSVRVTDACVPGTIDEEIRVRVLSKAREALQIQDVREILNRLVNVEVLGDE